MKSSPCLKVDDLLDLGLQQGLDRMLRKGFRDVVVPAKPQGFQAF